MSFGPGGVAFAQGKEKQAPPPNIWGVPRLLAPAQVGVAEPSGIAYHAALDRLYLVSDDGTLAELDRAGQKLRVIPVHGDIEDVAVHAPSGKLLLISEKKSRLILFDPRSWKEERRWHLDRVALLGEEPEERNRGFEGLAFRTDAQRADGGLVYLTHQRQPAMILSLKVDVLAPATDRLGGDRVLTRWVLKGHKGWTAITYAQALDRLLLIDGRKQRIVVLDTAGRVVAETSLTGLIQPEGLCLDARGDLWIADDQQGVLRYTGALAALQAYLSQTH
jgi:uncharacterized protein YjiK